MYQIIVNHKNTNQRIDKLVRKVLSDAPLSFIYRLFRIKDIKVNGKRTAIDYIVKEGDIITIYINEKQLEQFKKEKPLIKQPLEHQIVYEDEQVLIVNKPSGLLVHGDLNEKRRTLTNQVLNYLYFKGEYNEEEATFIAAPAHRLDRNTSGLVIFGKTNNALQQLHELFKQHRDITKRYLALVVGKTDFEGIINKPLVKDENRQIMVVTKQNNNGKSAITQYKTIRHFNSSFSLVEITLITGRTHQIRAHMQSINHPLVGDRKYGDFVINGHFKKKYGYEHQFLHAFQLQFKNMEQPLNKLTNKVLTVDLLEEEAKLLQKLETDIKK